jgi:predicted nucleotidyltransferase
MKWGGKMAKTALDLTPEELRLYWPGRNISGPPAEERWKQAWELARTAAHLLHHEFGATRVVAFGSLAHRDWFGPWSDVDLAAWGIPASQFYLAVATVTGISQDFHVDLVDPGNCRWAVLQSI